MIACLMIVNYLYINSITVNPTKTDTPLIIYTNTVLPIVIAF